MSLQHNYSKQEIVFANKRRAALLSVLPDTNAPIIVQSLDIQPPQTIIMLSGGASNARLNSKQKVRLHLLFNLGIAHVAQMLKALIIDGGTSTGVMQLMGQGIADQGYRTPLLGVAPSQSVTYPGDSMQKAGKDSAALDENHSHFVLVEDVVWGGEVELMYLLGKTLGQNIPVITVLANGGSLCKQEILQSVRYGWPIIIITGSGKVADRMARLWRRKTSFLARRFHVLHPDPTETEIISHGNIYLFPLQGTPESLAKLIYSLCQRSRYQLNTDAVLKQAWELFARYDENANRQQKKYRREQGWLLWLSLMIIMLVVSQKQGLPTVVPWINQPLHYTIVLIPICISILLSIASHFNAGNKWVILRSSAEAIKAEIFRYRSHADTYNTEATKEISREAKLIQKINSISEQLMDTDVMDMAQHPYYGTMPPNIDIMYGIDDGVRSLSAEQYVTVRLGDQLRFFRNGTQKLERTAKWLRWIMYVAGGAGTLLAAIGLELWVTLTITIFTSCTTYMEYIQVEGNLRKYNMIVTRLESVKNWWIALKTEEKTQLVNKDKLVVMVEAALQEEGIGWVSLMQEAVGRASDADRLGRMFS